MKKIAVLAIGGTISSRSDDPLSTTNYAPVLSAEELTAELLSYCSAANIELFTEDIFKIDSASLSPRQWLQMAQRTQELLDGDFDGVVITHGTDTMEESAYFLNLCVKSDKPVIFTGAMRPASALSADGPLNLYQAITAAASDVLRGCGVLVEMNGVLIAARDARKIHPTRTDAFTPVEMGKIGSITDGHIELFYIPAKCHTINSEFDCCRIKELPEVGVLYAYAGAPEELLDLCETRNMAGIVIAGVGNGNISTSWYSRAAELAKKMAVVRCTRANGFVNHNGSQNDDADGFISGGTLSAQKARILLMFAMANGYTGKRIQEVFDRY